MLVEDVKSLALAQIRSNDAARIGSLTVLYYMTTTFLSTFVRLLLLILDEAF